MSQQHLRPHNCYQNCEVYSPDGELMFRCSLKRAQWYLKRGLAEEIPAAGYSPDSFFSTSLCIRLTFEPQGRGHAGHEYYLSHKKNQCVVCGSEEKLTKHHVVPSCYRKSFPEHMKSHTSYDIFLVCAKHHEEYEEYAWAFKLALGEEYDVPMQQPKLERETIEGDLLRACKAASALVRHGDQIPEERQNELRERALMAAEENEEPEKTIERLATILEDCYHKKRKSLNIEGNFGAEVVARLEDVEEFIRRWRRHFIETMNPEFLPEHWEAERDWRGY